MRAEPSLWFRASERISKEQLITLLKEKRISASPRLGIRDETHDKGYVRGDQLLLEMRDKVDGVDTVLHSDYGRVTDVVIKQLSELTPADLTETIFYSDWTEVQTDLSGFDGNQLGPFTYVSIIHFEYVTVEAEHVSETETITA